VEALETRFDPYIATERRGTWSQVEASATPATAKARMAAKVRRLKEGAVQQTQGLGEPVFGQRKEARGFRRFLLRGLAHIRGEWRLSA